MVILVVGSVAFDSVTTPFGKEDGILGGSASYFSISASFFSPVNLVAVVGEDFPESHLDLFRKFGVDLRGLQQLPGKTFRWVGEYGHSLNEARTIDTQLNVFERFEPQIPEAYRDSQFVFLGNIDPVLQRQVLSQVSRPRLVACDTMNYWIRSKPDELRKTLGLIDILIINDAETRMLAGESNLNKAARVIRAWGPKTLVVKKGEFGVAMYSESSTFGAPAFPLEEVYDPTGAGDSFAGGFVGYLAKKDRFDDMIIRKAIIYGSVMASFSVEAFSLTRLIKLTPAEIQGRYREYKKLTHFEEDEGW
ncbi:MAG TPA: PfkB family carbohydrate kinase [Terriglobia bacterium]|nr:PfkB family carbohydrate kinase [Terriglobia bacterium]